MALIGTVIEQGRTGIGRHRVIMRLNSGTVIRGYFDHLPENCPTCPVRAGDMIAAPQQKDEDRDPVIFQPGGEVNRG